MLNFPEIPDSKQTRLCESNKIKVTYIEIRSVSYAPYNLCGSSYFKHYLIHYLIHYVEFDFPLD